MRRTGCTPIDDDAEKAETRPLEASMPLSIKGSISTRNILNKENGFRLNLKKNGNFIRVKLTMNMK